MMENGVTIIIPTRNGGRIFRECLEAIKLQEYEGPLQLIIIDSDSTDKTVELAMKAGALVQRIASQRFHHAGTRNKALSLADHEKIVFMVQDAIPLSESWLTALVQALDDYPVVAVYTAQKPHDNATPFAHFEIESTNNARGHDPVLQAIESLESYAEMPYHRAYRTIGLDNVCAIYRKERLLKAPFPNVDFAEDMAWAQKNLLTGHKILYNPRIKVKHSHNRSPDYAFRRQIINSFWCAKIMGRVENDLSSLNAEDLRTLTGGVLRFVSTLKSGYYASESGRFVEESLLREIFGGYPRDRRLKRFLTGRIFWRQKQTQKKLQKVADNIESGIHTLFHLIREKYQMKDEKKQMLLLDQIVANVVGRAYGEVYASCLLNDNISASLESLIRPFFHGV